jgi:phosphoglycerate dehydrogenase-like enzyme
MRSLKLLVLNDPVARYLKALARLPENVDLVVGDSPESFAEHAADADAVFIGLNKAGLFHEVWPSTRRVQWVHSFSAGVEPVLTPEFVASPVPLTNGRGVFARSLSEFVIAAILFFAKDLRRMVRNQDAGKWEQFDVEEIFGKTLGVVGYGEIGRASAMRAHALGMHVIAMRRNPESSLEDPYADKVLGPDARLELMAESDYVVVAAPDAPHTRGLIGEAELRAMKPTAVIINVGRGPVIVESALIRALEEKWIRGAALDVFDTEPLPSAHPFWKLDNVLLSPHSADHTATWLDDAMGLFVENFQRFADGQPLLNIVNKHGGY